VNSGGWGGAGPKECWSKRIDLLTNTTPAAPIKGGFALFFDGAATPPLLRLRAIALALRGLRRGKGSFLCEILTSWFGPPHFILQSC